MTLLIINKTILCQFDFEFLARLDFITIYWRWKSNQLFLHQLGGNIQVLWSNLFFIWISLQDEFYSTALKTLISVSTVILLGLIVAYHALEVQVMFEKMVLNPFKCLVKVQLNPEALIHDSSKKCRSFHRISTSKKKKFSHSVESFESLMQRTKKFEQRQTGKIFHIKSFWNRKTSLNFLYSCVIFCNNFYGLVKNCMKSWKIERICKICRKKVLNFFSLD